MIHVKVIIQKNLKKQKIFYLLIAYLDVQFSLEKW